MSTGWLHAILDKVVIRWRFGRRRKKRPAATRTGERWPNRRSTYYCWFERLEDRWVPAAISTVKSGNWSDPTVWSTGTVPTAADTVTINVNYNVTLDQTGNVNALTISATAAGTALLAVGNNTLNAGSITIKGGAAGTTSALIVGNGTINVTGNLTFMGTAAQAQLTSTGSSTINVGGNLTNGGTLTTNGTGVIVFNGTGNQTIGRYTTYNNIVIANSTGVVSTVTNGFTANNLTLNAGAKFKQANNSIVNNVVTVNSTAIYTQSGTLTSGTLSLASGASYVQSGTLTVNNALTISGTLTTSTTLNADGTTVITNGGKLITSTTTGAKNFGGKLTINAGGIFQSTSNVAATFSGGIQNDGTFTAGTATNTFNASQTISGTNPLTFGGNFAISSGVTVTNNTTITVAGNITGGNASSTFNNASSTSVLNAGGAVLATGTLNASASGNVVNYNDTAAQTIKLATYSTLKVNNTVGASLASGTTTIGALYVGDETPNSLLLVKTNSARISGALTLVNGSITGTTGVVTAGAYDVRSGTISAILNGTGALTKNTTGTVTLSGNNSYSGGTTINAGILRVAADANLGAPSVTTSYQGFGASTTGGNNYSTVTVTSLADSGAGTLRNALSSGNRKIVFSVSGTINLSTAITVTSPNITIDGASSPGGITISGRPFVIQNTHDIIVSHLSFKDSTDDNVRIFGNSYNIVVDHITSTNAFDGALDINVDYNNPSNRPHDITVSWSKFHNADKTVLVQSGDNITFHHNLFISNVQRNPQLDDVNNFDFRNNYVTDWGSYGMRVRNGSYGNIVDNVYGPSSNQSKPPSDSLIVTADAGPVYITGNLGPGSFNPNSLSTSATMFSAPWVDTVPANQVAALVSAGAGAGNQAPGSSASLTLNGGILQVTGSGFSSNRAVSLGSSGGSFAAIDGGILTLSGVISGPGAFRTDASNNGTILLTGTANTYTGSTTVSGGTLEVNGAIGTPATVTTSATLSGAGTVAAITASGTVSPGASGGAAIGKLTGASTDLRNGGTLRIQISGYTTAGTHYDQLDLGITSNVLTLDSSSKLTLDLGGFTTPGVTAGGIVRFGTLSGTFNTANITVVNNPAGLVPTVIYGAKQIDIRLMAPTTTAVVSSINPSSVGQQVTFTITVSEGTPLTASGTVTLYSGTTSLGTATLNGSGVATFNYSFGSAGTYTIRAVYGGDTNFLGSTSDVLLQVVN